VPLAAAFTAADGTYSLHLPPGSYFLAASVDLREVPAQWWNTRPSRREADPIVIVADGAPARAEFALDGVELR
jgi:hypothetical protein